MAERGVLRRFPAGSRMLGAHREVEGLIFVLSGTMAIYVDRGDGPHKMFEWHGGEVSGVLPYSRMKTSPGDTVAETEMEAFTVPREHVPELTRQCPKLTAQLVHVMLDRARVFTSADLHNEKMKSLGKLAAGLAHELNNPASAVVRSAKLLQEGLAAADAASRELGAVQLTDTQRQAVDGLRAACISARPAAATTPLESAERVDAITQWLEGHAADPALAGPLSDTRVTLSDLDRVSEPLRGQALQLALQWVAYACEARALAREIESSGSRIFELVSAVRGFTHLDQETVARPVDIGEELSSTFTMLRSKVKLKSAVIGVSVQAGLPRVTAYGGELNQVWMNLIDNALDAVPAGGSVQASAAVEQGAVVVRVTDDGPGIPPAILPRIFDPFFTTKPVGQGTGLGLDIVKRLLTRHNASIDVESHPGRTVFTVTLPAAARA